MVSVRRRPANSAEALALGSTQSWFPMSHRLACIRSTIITIRSANTWTRATIAPSRAWRSLGLRSFHVAAQLRALDQSFLISRIGSDVLNGLEDAGGISEPIANAASNEGLQSGRRNALAEVFGLPVQQ